MNIMGTQRPLAWGETFALAGAGGLAAFFAIYLYRGMLDPRDAFWLLREGESFQHYIGWHFFRHEPWGWPLGAVDNLATELSTSIVFTDSIPLYAIPLKLFHHWLPDTFQYLGLAVVINYFLNGLVACFLLLRLNIPAYVALAGALLISTLPVVVSRGLGIHGHEALTAHWLILLAIDFTLMYRRPCLKATFTWLLLLVVAVLMHFYLFFMAGVFWAAWWSYQGYVLIKEPLAESYRPALDSVLRGLSQNGVWWLMGIGTPLIVLLVMWAAGYFHLGSQSAASGGYDYYSAELLTFFNPSSTAWFYDENFTSMSALFPGWQPAKMGQYEGMAYVGAGVLLLWLVWLILTLFKRVPLDCRRIDAKLVDNSHAADKEPRSYLWMPAWIASLGLFAFAIAGEVSFGQGSIPLYYEMLFKPFRDYVRSSGRMAWPLLYLLMAITFLQLSYRLKAYWLVPLLMLALLVQWEDLREWHSLVRDSVKGRAEASRADPLAYDVLKDDELNDVWASHNSLVAFPAHDLNALKPYLWLAAEYRLSINVAYLARANHHIIDMATQGYRSNLQQGELPEGHVYLITDPELALQACRLEGWSCVEHQEVTIVWQDASARQAIP
ncbi:DUF6311 domain-containing protein [Halomonas sp. Bachu 37]|uniref:DUF6311 domain-containing protein n=1 Tax=Halomonas kashgarensis TaxID=3084920 RepID=UPI003217DECC